MENLINYLLQFGQLNSQQLDLIKTKISPSHLRFLAKRIEGDWLFTDLGNGQTKIEWTYKIIPKNGIARGVIKLVLLKKVTGLLTNALTILKNDLEK
jgi:hypothetical protein